MTVPPVRQRPGFTLIELLLVIVIVGLAGGIVVTVIARQHGPSGDDLPVINPLLIESVQQVRIAAARTTTMNNLRQLTIAAHNAHDTYKKFPPHWGFYPSLQANPNFPAQAQRRSLQFHILPYIEGANLYNAANTTAPFPPYLSPLDPTTTDGTDGMGRGVTSFLCNTLAFSSPETGKNYSRMPTSFLAGTSNTVFFVTATAHTAQGWHYWGGNPAQTSGSAEFAGNQPLPPLPLMNGMGPYQRGVQLSPAGSIVAMGDASTRTVAPTISPAVWQTVTNPSTTNPVPSDWNQK